jgi:hypothetical protein
MADDRKQEETTKGGSDGETINDPLTRDDVEAPRAEFGGRTPEE